VWRRTIASVPDERGSFSEIWRQSWLEQLPEPSGHALEMRQANVSRSAAGVLRGLHVHRRQADLWVVLEGRPFVALVDVRPALDGRGPVQVHTVEASAGDAFFLPEGVAHGFYAPEPLTLVYLVTTEYDGSDELGFAWDDPSVAIPWPARDPIVSGRDAAAPPLSELLATLRDAAP
jgi:dTDP-4-dehydrorhamnose 3,5-epimerase